MRDELEVLADILVREGVELLDDAQDPNRYRAWTRDEDMILKTLYIQHGGRWKMISTFLDRRTPDGARNRYKRILQKGGTGPHDRGEHFFVK